MEFSFPADQIWDNLVLPTVTKGLSHRFGGLADPIMAQGLAGLLVRAVLPDDADPLKTNQHYSGLHMPKDVITKMIDSSIMWDKTARVDEETAPRFLADLCLLPPGTLLGAWAPGTEGGTPSVLYMCLGALFIALSVEPDSAGNSVHLVALES